MNKRENYVNIDLDLDSLDERQGLVVGMFIHEGQLREQDAISDLLVKKLPPLLSDDEYDRGFEAGYNLAVAIINEHIHGPVEEEEEEIIIEEPEIHLDTPDGDDPE